MSSCCFQIYRAYSTSFNSSNVGIFSGVEFSKAGIEVQEKKRKTVVFCSRHPKNAKFDIFMSQSYSDGEEMYKKVCFRCKVVVSPI